MQIKHRKVKMRKQKNVELIKCGNGHEIREISLVSILRIQSFDL